MKIVVIGPDGKPMMCDVKKKDDCTFIVTLKPELVASSTTASPLAEDSPGDP